MGLFSFLSRKASQEQKDLASLRAQPYNATVAALPPFRGAYPVAGNGPDILDSLQKTQPSYTQVGEPFVDSFAPPPVVPIFRDEEGDRPRTAPSQESRGGLGSLRGLTTSLRNQTSAKTLESPFQAPPYKLSQNNPEQGRPKFPYRLPSKEHEQLLYTKPPPVFYERAASIRSGDSGMSRGFVDLLDAQSTISPIDFHERLQATGGKIYGEDVADRNIRENGVDLDSPAIRAFYGAPSRTAPLPPSGGTNNLDGGADLRSRAKRRQSLVSSLRTKSLTSSDVRPYPERTSSVIPSIPPEYRTPKTKKSEGPTANSALRRKSMPGYIVPSSPGTRTRSVSSASKQHTRDQDADNFPSELQDRGKHMASVHVADTQSIKSYGSNRRSMLVKNNRDSFVLAELNSDEADFGVARRISVIYPQVVETSRRKSIHSSSHSTKSVSGQSPSKRMSMHGMQSPLQRNPPDIPHYGHLSPVLEPGRSKRDLGSTSDLHDTTSHASAQLQAKRSPRLGSSHSHQNSNDSSSLRGRSRTRSLASASGRGPRKLDIEESIPERTSTIRQWSMDSTTATLSSLSSNPFRPHSRHTANTSVDLMPYNKGANSSRETFSSAAYHTASENYPHKSVSMLSLTSTQSGFDARTEAHSNFNIDDYVSSDDDDFSPRHPRGEGEEDLIFSSSGYGFDAAELPGLPSLLDFPTSIEKPRPSLSSKSSRYSLRERQVFAPAAPNYDSDFLSLPASPISTSWANSRARNSHFQPSKYSNADSSYGNDHVYGTDDEDTEEEISFDIPLSRGSTPSRQPPRASRWAVSQSDVIEEENDLVLESAAKIRREAKKLDRMSVATVRKRKESFNSRLKESVYSARRNVSNGSDADIE